MTKYIPLLLLPILSACTSPTQLPISRTAYEQYSALGYHEKNIAGNFYGLGQADAWKKLYWAQRRSQETGATNDQPKLQRRYFNTVVPEHVDPATGTVIEQSNQAIEIVQFVEAVKSHGRTLNIVK